MLGEGDEIDVAVDRGGHAEPRPRSAPNGTSRSRKNRALPADARPRARPRPAGRRRRPRCAVDVEPGVADAAAHAVLDEIGDDGGRLPVDADRQRQRAQDVGAEIGHRDRDLVGRELDADDMRGVRVELEHHARPAASRVAHGADAAAG